MRRCLVAAVALVVSLGCELNITAPTPAGASSTNTIHVDIPPTPPLPPAPTPPALPPTPGQPTPGTLPSYGQSVLQATAAAFPQLVASSCQITHGAAAWQFMDTLITRLKLAAGDARWGYICRNGNCGDPSPDVVGYLGSGAVPSTGARGTFGIDVIQGHCGTPVAVWNELGYDPAGTWSGTRY
jgi:hypothetical protein